VFTISGVIRQHSDKNLYASLYNHASVTPS